MGLSPSVCLSVSYKLLIQKQKGIEKPELVRNFPRTKVTGMAVFSLKGQIINYGQQMPKLQKKFMYICSGC